MELNFKNITESFIESQIEEYRKFYTSLIPYNGRKHEIIQNLERLNKSFVDNISNTDLGGKVTAFRIEELIKEIQDFLKTTFKKEIVSQFNTRPAKQSGEIPQDIEGWVGIFQSVAYAAEIRAKEKLAFHKRRSDFLTKICHAFNEYGLNEKIWQREIPKYGRYNLIIEYIPFNRKRAASEVVKLLPLDRVQKEYISLLNNKTDILINGIQIPYASITKRFISCTVLKDEEITLFKERYNLKDDIQFVKKCNDVTNDLLKNPGILPNIDLSADIWNLIHPRIREASYSRFTQNFFSDAAFRAVVELNDFIKIEYKKLSNEEYDGDSLMRKVFSPKDPVFVLSEIKTSSGQSIQQGYMEIFAGIMKAFRNPKAHKNFEISAEEALEKIILASHLVKVFENRKTQ